MSKVICDICGTTYPATSEQCPICGYTRDLGGMEASEELLNEQPQTAQPRNHVRGGRFPPPMCASAIAIPPATSLS